jgi:hypothetical protein
VSPTESRTFYNYRLDIGGTLDPADYYLARVGWWPDGSVAAQVENRSQSLLQLLRIDPLTGNFLKQYRDLLFCLISVGYYS